MTWKERIEQSPVVWLFGIAFAAFVAGFGAYQTIITVGGLEVVRAGSHISRSDLSKECASQEESGASATPSQLSAVLTARPDRVKAYIELADDFHKLVVEGEALAMEGSNFSPLKVASWFDRGLVMMSDPLIGGDFNDLKPLEALKTFSEGERANLSADDRREVAKFVVLMTETLRVFEFLTRRMVSVHEAGIEVPLPKLELDEAVTEAVRKTERTGETRVP